MFSKLETKEKYSLNYLTLNNKHAKAILQVEASELKKNDGLLPYRIFLLTGKYFNKSSESHHLQIFYMRRDGTIIEDTITSLYDTSATKQNGSRIVKLVHALINFQLGTAVSAIPLLKGMQYEQVKSLTDLAQVNDNYKQLILNSIKDYLCFHTVLRNKYQGMGITEILQDLTNKNVYKEIEASLGNEYKGKFEGIYNNCVNFCVAFLPTLKNSISSPHT